MKRALLSSTGSKVMGKETCFSLYAFDKEQDTQIDNFLINTQKQCHKIQPRPWLEDRC